MSLVEAIANVMVGYGIAVLTQLVVFPWFGLPARIGDTLAIALIFTAVASRVHSRSAGCSRQSELWPRDGEPPPVEGDVG